MNLYYKSISRYDAEPEFLGVFDDIIKCIEKVESMLTEEELQNMCVTDFVSWKNNDKCFFEITKVENFYPIARYENDIFFAQNQKM